MQWDVFLMFVMLSQAEMKVIKRKHQKLEMIEN